MVAAVSSAVVVIAASSLALPELAIASVEAVVMTSVSDDVVVVDVSEATTTDSVLVASLNPLVSSVVDAVLVDVSLVSDVAAELLSEVDVVDDAVTVAPELPDPDPVSA